ncbi:MAG: SufE family protein [Rickettsiales bacterium]
MTSAKEELTAIAADFALFSEWEERYAYVIELGKSLPPFPEDKKTDETRVRGCVSAVWLAGENKGGRVFFSADSDAALVRGLLAVIVKIYGGRTSEEIKGVSPEEILGALGFDAYLTPGRQNGFRAAVERVRALA